VRCASGCASEASLGTQTGEHLDSLTRDELALLLSWRGAPQSLRQAALAVLQAAASVQEGSA